MKRKRNLLLSFCLILMTAVVVRADDVDDWVKSQMQARHIPAVSIVVIKNGVVLKTAAYGLADMEHNVPAKADTVFKIGSTSKQFIAAGVMLLVQDGKIAVDEKVRTYLKEVPATWQAITIRQLLTHTSGLAREAPGFDPYKIQPDIDVIKTAFPVPLNAKPGDAYDYSNLGYYVLAEVLHTVSGKPWPDFLKERIFGPLGMNATRPTSVFDVIPNRADGYVWTADRFSNAENWLALRPSGAFLSTAPDMAKWETALQTGRILTGETKKEMWTPVKLNNGQEYPYGFGWEVDHFPNGIGPTDVPMIRHEGTIPGFRSAYWRLPNQNIAVIVLSNLDRAGLDNMCAGILVRYVPDVMPAYLKRWPVAEQK
jgi:CubicO group peptidase (beta-lactamase class C family)